ncbi:MAG: ComF family protein [Bacteroidales bacterium]|nr:ComF family protein [Bacteroidales bacterium]
MTKRSLALLDWTRDALRLLLPSYCMICGRRLDRHEEYVCTKCFNDLPFTRLHGEPGNVVERLFWAMLPIRRANALLHYQTEGDTRYIFFQLKYYNRPRVGRFFGRIMARDLLDTDFFDTVDVIIPLPLHAKKERKRGYNQSLLLAQGISEVTGLPIDTTAIVRWVDNPTQTQLTPEERRENVQGIFHLAHPERVANRHVLLVDDVLTTNATLLSCGRELVRAGGVSISILTLGLAGQHAFPAKDYIAPW